ncbi:hypothetical protein [Hymenobacter glacieicola]|uniref:Uncharacterized protein n=1 Tax=Hymenobacter glacieicola TaxID=1562124 RepID=A0ABQ1X780_9BACT|nr:hypothetical protein [Hymenobacter glacieicola]GGG61221.1 hypothetical protein GCM10011378_41530 [Hymenobacter glacieicola]
MSSRTTQEHIDEIMDTFDFHKVQRHMELIGWKWARTTPAAVPDVVELRQAARTYLQGAAQAALETGFCYRSSGGLHVYAQADPDTKTLYYLTLHFSLEYWTTCE